MRNANAIACVIALVACAAPAFGQGGMQTATVITTYAGVTLKGDFNGDGKQDLAIWGVGSSSTIAVALGNGDGTFQTPLTADLGVTGAGVVADFNGDGKLDLAVATSTGMAVFLGNGNGTFQATPTTTAATLGSTAYGQSVTGDINGDGKADIVVIDGNAQNFFFFLGVGDGTFTVTHTASGISPQPPQLKDINGDGKLDLLYLSTFSSSVFVQLGNGDGTFGSAIGYPLGATPPAYSYGFAVADFDQDGKVDVVAGAGTHLAFLKGNGDGSFQTAATALSSFTLKAIGAVDFDGDGKTDLIVEDNGSNDWIYTGAGNGTFSLTNILTDVFGGSTGGFAVADFNADSAPDVAFNGVIVAGGGGSGTIVGINCKNGCTTISITETSNTYGAETFQVTVTPKTGVTTPTGTITLSNGSSGPLVNGTASIQVTSFGGLIKATYPGDGNYAKNISAYISATTQAAPTSTSISVSPNPAASGQTVTINGHVGVTNGASVVPTGTVTLSDNNVALVDIPLDGSGNASFTKSTFTHGHHLLKFTYNSSDTSKYATSTSSTVDLAVEPLPPTFAKAFGAASIFVGGTTSLTFTIQNTNSSSALSGIGFTDNLPSGLVVATPAGLSGGCGGGAITAAAGSGTVSLAGASLAIGASCSFSVNVTGTTGGTKNNLTGAITSTEGGTGSTASASLIVYAPPTADSVSPTYGDGDSQFQYKFSSPNGYANLATLGVLMNSGLTYANSCAIKYEPGNGSIYLINDAGDAWLGPVPLGTGALSNSQCQLRSGSSSTSAAGNTRTLNLIFWFSNTWTGTKTNWGIAVDNNNLSSGWVSLGVYNPRAVAPKPLSVTPSSGSGLSQTFAYQFSDTNDGGYTAINDASILINSGLSYTGSCGVSATFVPSGKVYLINDAGTAWQGPLTIGQPGTLSNSQCTLDAGASSWSGSGSTLTLNLALTFNAGFSGTKSQWAAVEGIFPPNDASWMLLGTWTPTSAGPPTANSVTPNSGSGLSQTFAYQFSDPGGYTAIADTQVIINGGFTYTNSCGVMFTPGNGFLYLINDAANTWQGPVAIGQAGTLSNSQCTLNAGTSSQNGSGNNLTLNLALTFNGGFGGTKSQWGLAADYSDQSSGWVRLGTWSPVAVGPPTVTSVTPNSGTGLSQTFAYQFSDAAGYGSIATVQMMINGSFTYTGSCGVMFTPGNGLLYLINDAANAWQGPVAIGQAGTLSNSQCTLNAGTSSTSGSGNNLTVNLALTFGGGFTGSKTQWAIASDYSNQSSAWTNIGSWTP